VILLFLLQKCTTICKRKEREDDYDNGGKERRIRGGKKERNKKLQFCLKICIIRDRTGAG
jgi:hypothetical protein